MKISAFVCTLNPEYWCFPYQEALKSYCDLADEIIVIDSNSTDGSLNKMKGISDKIRVIQSEWPWEYKQREYPLHYNQGFDNCTGDWAFKLDIDFVFHEHDILAFKRKMQENNENPDLWVATLERYNVLNRTQFFNKGRMFAAIHKKFTKDKIRAGVPLGENDSDWTVLVEAKKVIDGVPHGLRIGHDHILDTGLRTFNYDCFFRTKEKCKVWFERAARAYMSETNYPLYGKDNEDAWKIWRDIRTKQKDTAPLRTIKIEDHPIYIQDKLKNMTPDMWGHSNFGWKL